MPTPSPTPRPRPTAHARPKPGTSARPLPPIDLAAEGEPRLPGMHRPGGTQPIRVPSLLASLKRHAPEPTGGSLVKAGSVAAIAIGAALFVGASLATPLVSANVADDKPAAAPAAGGPSAPQFPPMVTSTPSAAALIAVDARPQAKAKAPADSAAISSLAANGIPKVALNAYRVAAARVNNADPGCGIDWSLLAGIGRAESDHGRFAGSTLRTDGTSTPPIVGPPLTGTTWEYFPAAPEYIRVTGDAKYAHALGPMQFIPSTWQGYGADADGDGKADIFDINDAALAAARYLCVAGGDLRTQAGKVKAVLAYNHNDQYLAQVLALADAYKRGVPVSGLPVGNVTGTLPTIGRTGSLPPVNPGAPTAVGKDKPKSGTKGGSGTKTGGSGSTSGSGKGGSAGGSGGSGSGGSGSGGSGSGGTSSGTDGGTTGGSGGSGGSGGGSSTPPSGGSGGSSGGGSTPPTSTAPTSSAPSPSSSLKDCNRLEKLADMLLPPNKRVCA